ncbi:MAG: HEAT repeat protein [Methanobacterium sp. PtaU1.Bin242]|nr:MAG: HEAT repeat protein [Methanobacterium sp. PtaU1.Bin242]
MEMSKKQIIKLINKLNDVDYDVRKNVENILIKQDEQSIDPLINALEHENPEIQLQAAQILGKIGDKKALDPLLESLRNENPEFRREVTLAISKIIDKNP